MKRVKQDSDEPEPFYHNPGGGPSENSTARGTPESVRVIVIHAGFGDATLLEVEHDNGRKNHFLIDGGPTHIPNTNSKYRFFENLIETLFFHSALNSGEFKLDGIVVTHPDSDHSQGIIELFKTFPPNTKATNRASFLFKGPLLLTKAFWKKGTDEYSFVSHLLKQSQFVGKVEGNASPLLGFEKIFSFHYPDPNATGVVYNYVSPSPDPYPCPGKAPKDFDSNKTSILMLVNDPAEPSKPIVSLNGDGDGQSILQLVKGKHLKIFKVPHHGSKNNSLALNRRIPDGQSVTKKFLATQALLELVKRPQKASLAKILVGDKCEVFVNNFREKKDDKLFGDVSALCFDELLREVAEMFEVELKREVHDTDQLLTDLEERKKKIESNLANDNVQPKDVYTNGTALPKFTVKIYSDARSEVIEKGKCQDERVSGKRKKVNQGNNVQKKVKYQKFEAFNSIFEYLETDDVFLDQVEVRFITEFYSHINADTFFISSGNLHNHPHPCVINGIIEAAKKKHAEVSDYSCRLLLTSGNNIKETSLPDYPNCKWKEFVSLQYFLGTTASVVIDPNISASRELEGTSLWDGPGKICPSLRSDYDTTQGACALKRLRATPQNHSYQITSINGSWLYVSNDEDVQLATTKKVVIVKNIPHTSTRYDMVFRMSLKSDVDNEAEVYGLAGYHVPGVSVSYKLFVYEERNGNRDRKYIFDDGGMLKYIEELSNATSFLFSMEPLPITNSQSQSGPNGEDVLQENIVAFEGMAKSIGSKTKPESMQRSTEGITAASAQEEADVAARVKEQPPAVDATAAGLATRASRIPLKANTSWSSLRSLQSINRKSSLNCQSEPYLDLFCNTSDVFKCADDTRTLHSLLTSAYGTPSITETLEDSQQHLSHFLKELLSWKLEASPTSKIKRNLKTANIVLKPPSSAYLGTNLIKSATVMAQIVPELKIKIECDDENNIPIVLTYKDIQWCKGMKDGHSTITVNQARAMKRLTGELSQSKQHPMGKQLSVQEYLNSIGFTGDSTSIFCEALLDILLTEQIVSQLKNSREIKEDSFLYQFLQAMFTWVVSDSSTITVSEEGQVIFSYLNLKMPSTRVKFSSTIQKVVLKIKYPCSPNLKLKLKLKYVDDADISSTTKKYKLEHFIKIFPQNFDLYLQAIGVTPPDDGFNLIDAVILILQSETTGYFVLNSFAQALISTIRGYRVNAKGTAVTFYTSPTNVFLSDEVQVVADVDDYNNKLNIGLSSPVILKKLAIIIPLCIFNTHISAEVEICGQELKMSAHMMPNSLPSMEFKSTKQHSLVEVLALLQLDLEIEDLHFPIFSEKLTDIIISEAGFTISQAVGESNSTTLSSLFFCVDFCDLGSCLPHFFSKLQNIKSRAVVYFPSIPSARKVGFSATFSFVVQEWSAVSLSATLNAQPVLGAAEPNGGYNFSVSIDTSAVEGISLANMLSAFGISNALPIAMEIPIVESLLDNTHLKEFTIDFNTKRKAMEAFSLHLLVPYWELIPSTISITMFDLFMSYSSKSWEAAFESHAVFGSKYCVFVKFKLSISNRTAVIDIENHDQSLSVAAFFSIFDLSIDEVPLMNQVLQICIVNVHLSITKPSDKSSISIEQGWVTLYVDSFKISDQISLNQVSLRINFTRDKNSRTYTYGFRVAGFINDKVYLDVGYDPDDSSLVGHVLISSFKEADLSCVVKTFLDPSNSSTLESSKTYKSLSGNSAAEIFLAFDVGTQISLRQLKIEITGKLKLVKTLFLTSMQFEYVRNSKDGEISTSSSEKLFPSEISLSLIATMCSDESQFYAILQFDLNTNSKGSKSITASLKPAKDHALKLSSFLSLLELSTPDIPSVEGQRNPAFLDLELTSGSLTFSVSPYDIQAFNLQIDSPNAIELMASPKVLLEKVSLKVAYDHSQSSTLQVFLQGTVCLAGIKLCLEGSKSGDHLIFNAVTSSLDGSKTEFKSLIKQLTPYNCTVPCLPSDAGLPTSLPFGVAELTISLIRNERSFVFCGAAQNLNWRISLGFKDFTVNRLGGIIEYNRKKFTCLVTGQFQLCSNKTIDSELHFGNGIDTTLVVLIKNAADLRMESLIDDTLGFSTSTNGSTDNPDSGRSFHSLLPKSAHSIDHTSIFINLNLSKSQFLVAVQLVSLGTGFLFAGKLGKEKYGYAFGISLPSGFKFSQLLSDLSMLDDVFHVRKANVIILSLPEVKVSDIVAAMKDAHKNFIFQGKKPEELPFSNLVLDTSTKNKTAGKGMSFYAEIDFNKASPNSVFSSIDKIRDKSSSLPDVVLSAQISSSQPEMTRFEAHINHIVLSDFIKLENLSLEYQPYNQNKLTLVGEFSVRFGSDSDIYTYKGELQATNTEAKFSLSNDSTVKPPIIRYPFGMFGVSLEKSSLSLYYRFPNNEPHTSQCEISGDVNFYSHCSPSSEGNDSPTICLKSKVVFVNTTPVLVAITIEPTKTLTISDFVATVFKWDYGSNLKAGFTKGHIYYARPTSGQPSLKIGDQTFHKGYHISADVEVFSHFFNIQADIDDERISISGSAHEPIDLSFIKLIGINEQSELDESRSPKLSFTTTKHSTEVNITGGVVLLGTPLAIISLGYDVSNQEFYGDLVYPGNIGFIHNPSLRCSWSSSTGFKIDEWPICNPLPFDFLSKLKKFVDNCGSLDDLEFNCEIETKFNINCKLSKSVDPKEFIAMIDITGTFDFQFSDGTSFSSIDIPPVSVGIPNSFDLHGLATFILEQLIGKAALVVAKIATDPKKLAIILGVVVLNSITSAVASTLNCRKVIPIYLDPEIGSNKDITEHDYKEAEMEINKINELIEEIKQHLKEKSLEAAANAGANALNAIKYASDNLLDGIITALSSLEEFFKINSYMKKNEKAKRMKSELEDKRKEVYKLIEDVLNIGSPPIAEFHPPDKLKVYWTSNGYRGNKYHVHVNGSVLVTLTTSKSYYRNEIVSTCSVEIRDEKLYNAIQLTVTVRDTVSSSSGHTFKGREYSVDVPNVHPTLHSPEFVSASFDSTAMLIIAELKSTVQFANKYSFQLGKRSTSFKEISRPFTEPNKCPGSLIKHSFSHSIIPNDTTGPLVVRCQALYDAGIAIHASDFVYSNSLKLVPPVSDLRVVLPHFQSKSVYVNLTWSLPVDLSEISTITCQALEMDTEARILTWNFEKKERGQGFPTSCQFSFKDITNQLNDLLMQSTEKPKRNTSVSLGFQVYTMGKSDLVVYSVFRKQIFPSLRPPPSVSFEYFPRSEKLRIFWEHTQETNEYGIEILDDKDIVLFSNLVTIFRSDDVLNLFWSDVDKASLDRCDVTNANMVYKVQVTSATSGNEKFDSFLPTAALEKLHVCMSPIGKLFFYLSVNNTINIKFSPVLNATAYIVKIIGPVNQVLAEVEQRPDEVCKKLLSDSDTEEFQSLTNEDVEPNGDEHSNELLCSINADDLQLLASGDIITAELQSLGSGIFLSSTVSVIPNAHLIVQKQPYNVTYNYLPDEETIFLECGSVQGVDKYTLGFRDPSGLEDDVTVQSLTSSTSGKVSDAKLRSSKVILWKAFAYSVGDLEHLPSPLCILSQDILVLPKPSILSFMYTEAGNLSVSWDAFLPSSGYKVRLEVLDKENSTILKDVKDVNSTTLTTSFETSTIPKWPSILEQLDFARASVTAIGSGYHITSLPGDYSSITRYPAPEKLQYQYSSAEDSVALSFVRVTNVLQYYVGFCWQDKVVKVDVKSEDKVISHSFDIDQLLDGDKWKAFVQSRSDTTHFPSHKTFLEQDIFVLQKPHIESCTYNASAKELTAIWTCDPLSSSFIIKVVASKSNGTVLQALENSVQPEKASLQTAVWSIGNDIKDWAVIFSEVSTITVTVRAIGSEYCLSSHVSEPQSLCRISSPDYVTFKYARGNLAITWKAASDATGYSIAVVINGKLAYGRLVPRSCTVIKGINLMLLLSEVPISQVYYLRASVIPCSNSSQLPGKPEYAQIFIDTKLHYSNEFGGDWARSFDDISSQKKHVRFGIEMFAKILGIGRVREEDSEIVGIKAIWISFGDQINSLKTEYILTDGSTYVTEKHGGIGKHATCINFDVGEKLIAVHGSTTGRVVNQISFTTKTKLGSCKEYGPYGSCGPSSSFSVEGNIIGFYGRCGDNLNSVGVYYNQLWQKYYKSSSWGGHGSPFDDSVTCVRVPDDFIDDLSPLDDPMNPRPDSLCKEKWRHQKSHTEVKSVSRIKVICIKYDEFIGLLEVSYELDDGSTVTSSHGKCGEYSSYYRLQDGEEVTEIRGQVNGDAVAQLAYETLTKNGTKKTYGPYGSFGDQAFIVRGEIKAFYGQSSNCLNSVGLYFLPHQHDRYNKSPCWGGSSGILFDDSGPYIKHYRDPDLGDPWDDPFNPRHKNLCADKGRIHEVKAYVTGIKQIWIRHACWIDSLKVNYWLSDGTTKVSSQHGGNGGREDCIELHNGEKIVEVRGQTIKGVTDGQPWSYIAELTFKKQTKNGSQIQYGPYGKTQKQQPFKVQGNIVAFYGQSKVYLDSIGFYLSNHMDLDD